MIAASVGGRPFRPQQRTLVNGSETISAGEELEWHHEHVASDENESALVQLFLRFRLPADENRLEPQWKGLRSFHLERSRSLAALGMPAEALESLLDLGVTPESLARVREPRSAPA